MRPRVLIIAVGLLLTAGACSGGNDTESTAADEAGGVDAPVAADRDASGAGSGEAAPAAQQGEPIQAPRRVVYTAAVRLRVDDPAGTADRAVTIAEEAGGQLASRADEGEDEVTVTVRVPSADVLAVLDDLAALGRVLDRTVDTEDVTDQVVDLESRLANAEASVERLRGLYAEAQDVNQVVAVEGALTQREAEVESLTGQLRLLEDRADLSTVTVTFVRQGEPEVDDDIPGFAEGLRSGWVAFRNVAAGAVTAVGFLLPFLVVVTGLGVLTTDVVDGGPG